MEEAVTIKEEKQDTLDTYDCALPVDINRVNVTLVPFHDESKALPTTNRSTKTEDREQEMSQIHEHILPSPSLIGSENTEEHPGTSLRHFRMQEEEQIEEEEEQEMGRCNGEDEDEKEKEYVCPQCPYIADRQSNVLRHIKEIHEDRKYPCALCDHVAKRSHHLKKHVLARHTEKKPSNQPLPFNCDACGYGTEVRHRLVEHMRTHTGEKPYKCPHCDSRWPRKLGLDQHLARVHTGERPYMCGECGYSTVHRGHLVQHMRTHTGQRPYKCTECAYTASRKHHIDIHMVKHTDLHPFACEQCEFRTKYKSNLRQHMRVHMDPKPLGRFKCELCDFSGERIQFLDHHMKRKHSSSVQRQEPSV